MTCLVGNRLPTKGWIVQMVHKTRAHSDSSHPVQSQCSIFQCCFAMVALAGVWNNDATDDFMQRNGVLLTPSGTDGAFTEEDYFTFGETCEYYT